MRAPVAGLDRRELADLIRLALALPIEVLVVGREHLERNALALLRGEGEQRVEETGRALDARIDGLRERLLKSEIRCLAARPLDLGRELARPLEARPCLPHS